MNKTSALTALAIAALAMAAQAVPSGINYQGVLTDSQGQPVTGTRAMSIKLYDAATSGTPLYTEDLGTVSVTDGVFSFEFGTSGTSNAEQSDTVATTDGTATTFQKVLSASEVVAGSVSVTDGTYTWSQSSGSSNEDDFGVAYSTSLRRVTVNYYNGAPTAGRTITATYRTPASGVSGALAGDNQPWAEITVDGVAQVPRQKILTVPFALRALDIDSATISNKLKRVRIPISRFNTYTDSAYLSGEGVFPLNQGSIGHTTFSSGKGKWKIPWYARHIVSVEINFKTLPGGPGDYGATTGAVVLAITGSNWPAQVFRDQPTFAWKTVDVGIDTVFGQEWFLDFRTEPIWRSGGYNGGGGAEISQIVIIADVIEAVAPAD